MSRAIHNGHTLRLEKAECRCVGFQRLHVAAGLQLTYQQSVHAQLLQQELLKIHGQVIAGPQESAKGRLLLNDLFLLPTVR